MKCFKKKEFVKKYVEAILSAISYTKHVVRGSYQFTNLSIGEHIVDVLGVPIKSGRKNPQTT